MTEIKGFGVGPIQTNCYIIYKNGKALIVDPGGDPIRIEKVVKDLNVEPVAVILTHAHYDHIGALDDIREIYDIEAYGHPNEKDWFQDPLANLSRDRQTIVKEVEHLFEDYSPLMIDDFTFKVVPTPGHSPGSVSFIFEDSAFVVSGDALFKGSIGRTDLPEASTETLMKSIRENLFTLPDGFKVYPGHSESTTIGHEKATNPFFN